MSIRSRTNDLTTMSYRRNQKEERWDGAVSRLSAVLAVGKAPPLQMTDETANCLSEQVSALVVGAGFGMQGSASDPLTLGERLPNNVFAGVAFTMTGIMGEASDQEKREISSDIDDTKVGRTRLRQLIETKGGVVVETVPESLEPREARTHVLVVGNEPGYVKLNSLLTLWQRRIEYCEELLLRTFYEPPHWQNYKMQWKVLYDPNIPNMTMGNGYWPDAMDRGINDDGTERETVKTKVALNDTYKNFNRLKRLLLETRILDIAVVNVDWLLRWLRDFQPHTGNVSDDALEQVFDHTSVGRQKVSKQLRGCTKVENGVLRKRARETEGDKEAALCTEIKQFRAEWADKIRDCVGRSKELKTSVKALKTSVTAGETLEALRQMKRHADALKDKLDALRQSDARREIEMVRRQRQSE